MARGEEVVERMAESSPLHSSLRLCTARLTCLAMRDLIIMDAISGDTDAISGALNTLASPPPPWHRLRWVDQPGRHARRLPPIRARAAASELVSVERNCWQASRI